MDETTPTTGSQGIDPNESSDAFAFGFDDGDTWLDALREAERPSDLGRLGSWELLEEIDRGGQGIVWRARHVDDGRIAALKRPVWGALAGARTRRRFEREIEAASGLDHPGIVKVIGRESVDGQPVLALEWVEGEPVDVWAARHRHRPADVLRQFLDIADAVAHAHRRGVIHRDLKPSNVLVDSDGFPRVLDFGLAKIEDDVEPLATRSSDVLGTPAYAAPEQLSGAANAADARSDVYSLCVVLFEMLTGTLPYDVGGTLPEIVDRVRHATPARPSRVQPSLHRELDLIVLKGLSKDADDRYATVDALSEDIRRHLQGDAVLAHPPSTWYQFRKLVRRHRAACAVVVSFGVLVTAFAIVTAVQAARIADERDAAKLARDDARDEADRVRRLLALFTRDVFHAVRPSEHGPKVTLETCLSELAETAASKELAGDPALVLELRLLLTDALTSLGRFPEAALHAREALALADDGHGLLPRARGRCHLALGRALLEGGRFTQSLEHLDRAQALLIDDDDDVTFVSIALARGEVLGLTGRLDDAERALMAALDRRTGTVVRDDVEILDVLQALASLRLRQGRPEDADRLSLRALHAAQDAFGDDHVLTASAHTTRGTLLATVGRFEDAERHHRTAAKLRRAAFGDQHPHLITNLVSLAQLALQRGDTRGAAPLLDRAAAVERATLGEGGASSSISSVRAEIEAEGGNDATAVRIMERTLAAARRHLGPNSAAVGTIMSNLGPRLYALGRKDEGRAMAEEAVVLRRRHLGPDHPDLAHGLNSIGRILSLDGDHDGALAHYSEALEILERRWPEAHETRLVLQNNVASTHIRLGHLEEAATLYAASITMAHELERRLSADVRDPKDDLGVAHDQLTLLLFKLERWGDAAAAAAAWLTDCDAAKLPPEDIRRRRARRRLGLALAKDGKLAEGADTLASLWRDVHRSDGADSRDARSLAGSLADIYRSWGKPDQSAVWRSRTVAQ